MSFQDRSLSGRAFSSSVKARLRPSNGDGGGASHGRMGGGGDAAGVESSGGGSSLYASTVVSIEMEGDDSRMRNGGHSHDRRLNDQQWVLQRKKIGLSRRTKAALRKVKEEESHKNSVLDFIRNNFSRKECVKFVEDKSRRSLPRPLGASPGPEDAPVCHCGKPDDEHHTRAGIMQDDRARQGKARFETIGEEEEEEESDDDRWAAKGGGRRGSVSTASSDLPPILQVGGKDTGTRASKVGGGGGSLTGREEVYKSPSTEAAERYIDHKLQKHLGAQSVSLTSSIDGDGDVVVSAPDRLTSVDTANSLRMDIEKEIEDLGGRVSFEDGQQQQQQGPTLTTNPKAEEWVEKRSIQEFPTNAFGQIEFVNEDEGSLKPSKYIRLSDQTPMPLVKELLVDHWGLFTPFRPHLAISLIGGAKNFRMEGKKKETFKQGLISAAKSTNALILTGGNNSGSMKLVGDAIREGQYMVQNGDKMNRGLKLLGLCSFGYVKDFHLFVNPDVGEFNYVRYNSNQESARGDNVPLNGDHTHFLMIDDGARYRFFGAYTEFITRFETMVRDDETKGGLGIPIVTLLLEGGKDAIRIVKDRLAEGIPCVAVEGSGRAADIISYAYKNAVKNSATNSYTLKEGHVAHLLHMLTEAFGGFYKEDIAERDKNMKIFLNWTMECVRHSDIITIFDIRRETHLDKKILSALLKSHHMPLHQQLFLAMAWDRVDLVEEKLMVRDAMSRASETLNETMKHALQKDRVKFIELMIMNGFVMSKFLTVETLAALYNDAVGRFKELPEQLRRLTGYSGGAIRLRDIHKMLVVTLKEHRMRNYELDHHPGAVVRRQNFKKGEEGRALLDLQRNRFEEPYVELFIWAVLTNRPTLIDFLWHRCGEPALMAVVAAAIYSKLVWLYKGDNAHTHKVLAKRKTLFQDRANKLVELASETNLDQAVSLLEKRNNRFGGRNLMQLAHIGHLRNFIANPTCQLVLRSSWKRGFTKLPWYTCLLGFFLPFLVWTPLVRFVRGLGDDGGELTPRQKIYVFYRSPIVKYTGTCVSLLLFMLLYSYVALFSFRWEYQIPELVVYGWFLVMMVDELREVLVEPSRVLRSKFSDYFQSVWNKFDLLIVLVAGTAFALKNFRSTFEAARVLFALNCALFYMRIFRIYHASKSLGPKLVIFHRMIPEIVTFLFLLVVFILAYGVAAQALLDPYRQFSWSKLGPLLFEILFMPYWQMYGELGLDQLEVKDTPECSEPHTRSKFTFSGSGGVADVGQAEYCYPKDLEDINHYNYVTPALLAIYLLIGNVMLLNLLIAIFTSVFEEVHENSNDVWRWEMYRLVDEYDKKPGLPPPLVIVEDFYKLFKAIWKRTCRSRKENLDSYMQDTLATLRVFERDLMSTFMEKEKSKAEQSLERRIDLLEKKTDQLLELFEEAPNEGDAWGATIDAEEKVYTTTSTEEEEEEDEDAFDGSGGHRGKAAQFKSRRRKNNNRTAKRKGRGSFKPTFEKVNPKSARISTARASRASRRMEADIVDIKEQMERLEEQRRMDANQMEGIYKLLKENLRR